MGTGDFEFFGSGDSSDPIVAFDVVTATPVITVDVRSGVNSGALVSAGAPAAWGSSLTIAGPIVGPVLQFAVSGNVTNDPLYTVLVGFGDGYENYGLGAYHDFSDTPSGRYEALVHIITQAGARIGRSVEFDWDADTLTFSNFGSAAGNPATYEVDAQCVWAIFCGGRPQKVWTAAGNYIVQGALAPCKPVLPQSQWYEGDERGGGSALSTVPLHSFCAIVGTVPTTLTPILNSATGETKFYDGLGNEVLPADFTLAANANECCGCDADIVLVPGALDVTGTAVTSAPVSPVRSLTVTREAGLVEFSTDSGATWVRMNVNGSRTWSSPAPGQTIDVSAMRFRGVAATSNYDLIWEV